MLLKSEIFRFYISIGKGEKYVFKRNSKRSANKRRILQFAVFIVFADELDS